MENNKINPYMAADENIKIYFNEINPVFTFDTIKCSMDENCNITIKKLADIL